MPKPATVDEYVTAAPSEFRGQLTLLRDMIHRALPHAAETIGSSGFPVYTDPDGNWQAGFAWRKKGAMLYIMNSGVLDRYEDQLGKLRSGKSCVEWRAGNDLSMDELKELACKMLGEVAAETG